MKNSTLQAEFQSKISSLHQSRKTCDNPLGLSAIDILEEVYNKAAHIESVGPTNVQQEEMYELLYLQREIKHLLSTTPKDDTLRQECKLSYEWGSFNLVLVGV